MVGIQGVKWTAEGTGKKAKLIAWLLVFCDVRHASVVRDMTVSFKGHAQRETRWHREMNFSPVLDRQYRLLRTGYFYIIADREVWTCEYYRRAST
jgi:hypothetical protein